ncbi:alpha-ketoacid dehydrogenase kinase [Scenedesmus sp. NREL 46B-D3]|nr:alpha-ketoacid dehydrogenase kinase [Scenedesmus sp. NREL 46B-D3]
MLLAGVMKPLRVCQQHWLSCLEHAQQSGTAAAAVLGRRHVWNENMDLGEARKADSFYDSTVEKYAVMPVETLSLEQMLYIGRNVASDPSKILQSAHFVQQELPKRLARRLLDLQLLPHLVVSNPHIKRVYNAYFHAFETLRAYPPVKSVADNAAFCTLLRRLVDEHGPLLDLLARGLVEVRAKRLVGPALDLDQFLDAMLRSRISRRVIAEQHLHIANARPGYIGSIATALDVADAVDFAGQRAVQVCMEAYGVAPEVVVGGDLAARLPYLPSHLDYMLYELLKNSMRAVVERHRGATYSTRRRIPPIQARVCSGATHLSIRISDQGGGLPVEHLEQVWSYGFTTSASGLPDMEAQQQQQHIDEANRAGGSSSNSNSSADSSGDDTSSSSKDSTLAAAAAAADAASAAAADAQLRKTANQFGALLANVADAPRQRYSLAGLGFGLPLSRLHARYFGGDLQLVNLPGYGVDAFLTLRRLDTAGWHEQHDDDVAAAGQAAAIAAAVKVQQQLAQARGPAHMLL